MKRFVFVTGLLLMVTLFSGKAQEKAEFSVGADLVSSYLWRGSYLSGTSIQPEIAFEKGGFSVSAWGSTDIAGFGYKEVDLFIGYSFGNFYVGLSDLWSPMDGEGSFNYFDFRKDHTQHILEGNLGYTFGSFPLSLSWNTMLAGFDKYADDNEKLKKAYSTYIEAIYSFDFKSISFDAGIGASPWNKGGEESMYLLDYPHATEGFAVVNLSLTATREIKITDNYSFSVFGQLAFNPAKDDAFFVFGIRL